MKNRIFVRLTVCLLMLCLCLPLASCGSKKLLYSTTADQRTFAVLGGSKPNLIRANDSEGNLIFEESVSTDRSVGTRNGTYGLEIQDLNFDGYADIKLITHASGDVLSNLCYLYEPEGNTFILNEELSALKTVQPNVEQKAILSFAQSRVDEPAFDDAPASYRTVDTATAYIWKNGSLIPYRRASLTYNSAHNLYVCSLSDYSEALGEFLDPDDTWYTPSEYAQTDFGFLYYFK